MDNDNKKEPVNKILILAVIFILIFFSDFYNFCMNSFKYLIFIIFIIYLLNHFKIINIYNDDKIIIENKNIGFKSNKEINNNTREKQKQNNLPKNIFAASKTTVAAKKTVTNRNA
jgi:hypothetical protein